LKSRGGSADGNSITAKAFSRECTRIKNKISHEFTRMTRIKNKKNLLSVVLFLIRVHSC
jgi:hypothetical protein